MGGAICLFMHLRGEAMAEEKLNPEDRLMRAKSDALRLITFRIRSVSELSQRLRLKKYPEDVIADVIAGFSRQGLLDDEKFAKLYSNSQAERKVGKRQIEMDLAKKGVARDVIQKTVSELTDYDEKAAALQLVEKRYSRMKDLPAQKAKARLCGFLARRGFSQDVIFNVVNKLVGRHED